MKSKSKMSYNLSVILLIPLGIAINFVGANLNAALKLPVYLDVIGTVFTGVLCGPWIGFLTGVVTNIVTSVTNPTQLPYMIVSGVIGLVAGICGKKAMFKTPAKTFVVAVIIWLVAMITSAPITVLVFGGVTGASGSSAITTFLVATGKGLWESVIGSTVLTETLDKFLTSFAVYFLIKSIPNRNLLRYPNGIQYIKEKKNKYVRGAKWYLKFSQQQNFLWL